MESRPSSANSTIPVQPTAKSKLSHYVNWYYDFRDAETSEEFHAFNRERGPTKFFLLLWCLISIVVLPASLYAGIDHVVRMRIHHSPYLSHSASGMQRMDCIVTLLCCVVNILIAITVMIYGWQLVAHYHGWSILPLDYLSSISSSVINVFHSCKLSLCAKMSMVVPLEEPHFPLKHSRPSHLSENSLSFAGSERDNNPTKSITGRALSGKFAPQRVEISVLREFTVRSPHAGSNASPVRRTSPANIPSYFAVMPALQSPSSSNTPPPSFGGPSGSNLPFVSKDRPSSNSSSVVKSKARPLSAFSATSNGEGLFSSKAAKHNPKGTSSGASKAGSVSGDPFKENDDEESIVSDDIGQRVAGWNVTIFVLIEALVLSLFIQHSLQSCGFHSDSKGSLPLLPTGVNVCDAPDLFVIFFSFFLLLLPYLLFVALQDISIAWVWFMLTTVFLSVGGVIFYVSAHRAWLTIVIFLTFVGTMIIDAQIHKVQMFLTTRKLGGIVEENERMALHNHAQEMRHMIANVAHDLKTPLASFLTGLEYIQMVIDDDCRTNCMGNLNSIAGCVNNMRNTHSFMLMTINRCIDYTKASKGLRLIPKCETISLMETLELPLSCMRNMQQKIEIILNPMPYLIDIGHHPGDDTENDENTHFCPFVITDKQWLQENVLCLLSNAVKYSAEGVVTINVAVEEYYPPTAQTYLHDSDRLPRPPGVNECDDDGIRSVNSSGRRDGKVESPRPFHTGVDSNKSSQKHQPSMSSPAITPRQQELMPFLRIEVEDTGIGMSEEAMQCLFNPFKQTQRLAGGTGLGLYSLAKRIEALHGYYGVMKRRDGKQGSLFWFAIPYKPDFPYAKAVYSKTPEEMSFQTRQLPESSIHRAHPRVMNPRGRNDEDGEDDDITISMADGIKGNGEIGIDNDELLPPSRESSADTQTMAMVDPLALPVVKQKTSNMAVESIIASAVPATIPEQRPLHILLVDDSPTILKMSSLMLKKLGHDVTTADNGAVAVKLVQEKAQRKEQPFDVILMDLQMPIMDGLEATQRIRQMESEGGVRRDSVSSSSSSSPLPPWRRDRQIVIGMSANSDHETAKNANEVGMDAFLSKPFKVETFRMTLNQLLAEKL